MERACSRKCACSKRARVAEHARAHHHASAVHVRPRGDGGLRSRTGGQPRELRLHEPIERGLEQLVPAATPDALDEAKTSRKGAC
jgi:hypothetical protein